MNEFSDNMNKADFDGMKYAPFCNKIIFLDEIGSTQDYAKELGKNGEISGTVVIAANQVAGRGRLGRSWDGGTGKDIYMSILLRPDLAGEDSARLTLMAGICVANVMNTYLKGRVQIKWPNDVVVDARKICGIITEASFEDLSLKYMVMGIGVNINRENFPEELENKATSLYKLSGEHYNRAEIIEKLLKELNSHYVKFLESGIESFIDEYRKLCLNIGKTVMIIENGAEFTAKAVDIDKNGELIIETEDGMRRSIDSGEVSVRGIYGYI